MADPLQILEGGKPYAFISYAHKNSDRVMPIIEGLRERGFEVWYDAQIEAGTRWSEYVAKHISGCGCFLAMITKEFLESQNCDREIHYAINKNVPFLAVFLEEVTLSEGMEMQLGTVQALFYQRFINLDAFLDSLCNAEVMRVCKIQGVAPAPEPEYVKKSLTGEEIFQNGERLCRKVGKMKPLPGIRKLPRQVYQKLCIASVFTIQRKARRSHTKTTRWRWSGLERLQKNGTMEPAKHWQMPTAMEKA